MARTIAEIKKEMTDAYITALSGTYMVSQVMPTLIQCFLPCQ